jgi:leucyl aminopeptidase
MKIKLECVPITEIACDVLIVNEFEGVKHPGGATGAVDKALDGEITKLSSSGELNGKLCSTVPVRTYCKLKANEVICVGLGKASEFNYDKVRLVSDSAIKAAKRSRAKKVATIIHGAGIGGLDPKLAAQAVVEGSLLGEYKFKGFKTEIDDDDKNSIEELIIVDYDPQKIKEIKESVELAQVIIDATNKARDIINSPSNKITPTYLGKYAQDMAREMKLECQVLGRDEKIKKGMDALYNVSKGSKEEPKMIVIKYNGGGKDTTALIGKGITFDSGGISLKPSKNMAEMKTDMAGAATAINVMRAISKLKPKVNIIAVIPAPENKPGGDVY